MIGTEELTEEEGTRTVRTAADRMPQGRQLDRFRIWEEWMPLIMPDPDVLFPHHALPCLNILGPETL